MAGGKVRVSGPTREALSLAEARAHCRVDGTNEDILLAGWILKARQRVERETGRALLRTRWKATFDHGWPCAWDDGWRRRIVLPVAPVLAVVSVEYVDADGATQPLATTEYRAARVGDPARAGWIEPAYGKTWPGVQAVSEAVSVTFDAGYGDNPGDVPGELRQAVALLVGHWHENREATVPVELRELPIGVEALIAPFRLNP